MKVTDRYRNNVSQSRGHGALHIRVVSPSDHRAVRFERERMGSSSIARDRRHTAETSGKRPIRGITTPTYNSAIGLKPNAQKAAGSDGHDIGESCRDGNLPTAVTPPAADRAVVFQRQGVINPHRVPAVNTVLEGAEAVRRANTSSVKLSVDIFHMLRNGESPDDIVKVGPLIRHAPIAENRDRAAPGVNRENLRPFLRALRRSGDNEGLALEPTWTDLGSQLAPALAELRRQLADSGY